MPQVHEADNLLNEGDFRMIGIIIYALDGHRERGTKDASEHLPGAWHCWEHLSHSHPHSTATRMRRQQSHDIQSNLRGPCKGQSWWSDHAFIAKANEHLSLPCQYPDNTCVQTKPWTPLVTSDGTLNIL